MGYDYRAQSPLQTLPPGANIFGILPGKLWGTSRDRVVIIGAHWDTMTETDGYNDNGSGSLIFEKFTKFNVGPYHLIHNIALCINLSIED